MIHCVHMFDVDPIFRRVIFPSEYDLKLILLLMHRGTVENSYSAGI